MRDETNELPEGECSAERHERNERHRLAGEQRAGDRQPDPEADHDEVEEEAEGVDRQRPRQPRVLGEQKVVHDEHPLRPRDARRPRVEIDRLVALAIEHELLHPFDVLRGDVLRREPRWRCPLRVVDQRAGVAEHEDDVALRRLERKRRSARWTRLPDSRPASSLEPKASEGDRAAPDAVPATEPVAARKS